MDVQLTLVGGPTLIIEMAGVRLMTDPTFDPPGNFQGGVVLTKTRGPALSAEAAGKIDAVLLSHDQHFDNLDHGGRAFLSKVGVTYSTLAAAKRLGGSTVGLAPWENARLNGGLQITSTPARHGPVGIEPISGDVTGFAVGVEEPGDAIYISGDTVWFEGVAEAARRFKPRLLVLFTGSAQTRGAFHLTMDANDVLETVHAFPDAKVVAIHNDGWTHFKETQADIVQAFGVFGLSSRLQVLELGKTVSLTI
jgi:L-ascorbate metabolism protein UlaG (beta-lactamase superfamily)